MTYYFKTSLKCYLFISSVPILMPMCDNFSDKPNNTYIYIYIYIYIFFLSEKVLSIIFPFREWESDLSGLSAPPPGLYWETDVCSEGKLLQQTLTMLQRSTRDFLVTTEHRSFPMCRLWRISVGELTHVNISIGPSGFWFTDFLNGLLTSFLIYWFLKWASN